MPTSPRKQYHTSSRVKEIMARAAQIIQQQKTYYIQNREKQDNLENNQLTTTMNKRNNKVYKKMLKHCMKIHLDRFCNDKVPPRPAQAK